MVLCCMALSIFSVYARQIDDSTDCLLSVRVLNGKTGEPVDFAVVVLIAQAGERVFTESTGLMVSVILSALRLDHTNCKLPFLVISPMYIPLSSRAILPIPFGLILKRSIWMRWW